MDAAEAEGVEHHEGEAIEEDLGAVTRATTRMAVHHGASPYYARAAADGCAGDEADLEGAAHPRLGTDLASPV